MLTSSAHPFQGFGDSILSAVAREPLNGIDLPSDRMQGRSLLHDHCPVTPGVYGWLDCNNQICYVGKSKCLRKRLLSYFAKTPADKKAIRIRQHSQRIVWEPVSHELLALIREQELIYRWRPEFNTQGQPVKRQPAFICLSDGMAPNVFFSRRATPKAAMMVGPIAGTSRLRGAVESMNQIFQLRDCPDKTEFSFSNQQLLFDNPQSAGCIRYELGSCPAPCAAHCSSAEYMVNVQKATDFLIGGVQSKEVLDRLQLQMKEAALSQQFERASVIRDHFLNLRWLSRRLHQLEIAKKKLNGVLTLPGKKNHKLWLVLRGGRIVGSAAAPSDRARLTAAIERLEKISQQDLGLPNNLQEMNLQMIVMAWFRKYPKDKAKLTGFEQVIDSCRERLSRSPTAKPSEVIALLP